MEHSPALNDRGLWSLLFRLTWVGRSLGKVAANDRKGRASLRLDQPKILKCGILKSDLVQEVAIKVHQAWANSAKDSAGTHHLVDGHYATSIDDFTEASKLQKRSGQRIVFGESERERSTIPADETNPIRRAKPENRSIGGRRSAAPLPLLRVIEMHVSSDLTFRRSDTLALQRKTPPRRCTIGG